MKFLVIVNESPWQTGLALTAFRFVRAAVDSGVEVEAVFFREDGIYNALAAEVTDSGTPELATAWSELANAGRTRLLLCRSSRQRRLAAPPSTAFEESGLTQMMELITAVDRVVSF